MARNPKPIRKDRRPGWESRIKDWKRQQRDRALLRKCIRAYFASLRKTINALWGNPRARQILSDVTSAVQRPQGEVIP